MEASQNSITNEDNSFETKIADLHKHLEKLERLDWRISNHGSKTCSWPMAC